MNRNSLFFEDRLLARKIAFSLLNTPYVWGGDDPLRGFDCSGLVVEILKSVGILKEHEDYTADGLYRKFKKHEVEKPHLGCLAFWGFEERKTHVAFCISDRHVITASGGGFRTQTLADAVRQNAFVKCRRIDYRPGPVWFEDPFLEILK